MILIIDSFFTGSHKYWGSQMKNLLPFEVELLTLSGKYWKWRMEGGAIELAEKFKKLSKKPDLIIATDMVNLPLFYAYAGITKDEIPCIIYFHENQFAYPESEFDTDKKNNRDNHYGFINITSALFANYVTFNSDFNRKSFYEGATKLIKKLPDNSLVKSFNNIKSKVIYSAIDKISPRNKPQSNVPIILWNHRWEFDKNPNMFIEGLEYLQAKNIDFKLIILGKGTEEEKVKKLILSKFTKETLHCGFAKTKEEYYDLIAQATHLPVTSKHDFFGLSVAEAMNQGVFAILPNHQAYPEHLIQNESSGILYDFPIGYTKALENSLLTFRNSSTRPDFFWDSVIKDWTNFINSL